MTRFQELAGLVHRRYRLGRLALTPPLHVRPMQLRGVAGARAGRHGTLTVEDRLQGVQR